MHGVRGYPYQYQLLSSFNEDLFRTEVCAGLSARPSALSPRWFYDRRGSQLFEAITALPEYYVTRRVQ